jgi:hypothetical protein
LHLARRLTRNKRYSEKQRIQEAYLAIFQREPTAGETKHALKFIRAEAKLLAQEEPPQLVQRTSNPEADTNAPTPAPIPALAQADTRPTITLTPDMVGASGPAANSNTAASATNSGSLAVGDLGGGGFGGGGGGFRRGPRTYKGPGSASDVVVGKLATGIARPKVFHQALPEAPATPGEGAFALFTQALFGSAEFRYLQ